MFQVVLVGLPSEEGTFGPCRANARFSRCGFIDANMIHNTSAECHPLLRARVARALRPLLFEAPERHRRLAAEAGVGGMMPAGAGRGTGQERDRTRQAWMAEEDDLWGAGQPAVPSVISRD